MFEVWHFLSRIDCKILNHYFWCLPCSKFGLHLFHKVVGSQVEMVSRTIESRLHQTSVTVLRARNMKLECDMTNVSHHLIRHLILVLISFIHSGARLQRLLVCILCDPLYLITNKLRSPKVCVQSYPRWPGLTWPLLPRSDTLTLTQQCEACHQEPETGRGLQWVLF